MKKTIIVLIVFLSGATVYSKLKSLPEGECPNQKKAIAAEFSGRLPAMWAEIVPGVKTRIDTDKKVVALTFDACGSSGDGYDSVLIDYLIKNNIPATLFINARWIKKNQDRFIELSKNPLFEIENHGFTHKPCSVNGKTAYGIKGTGSPTEIIEEIDKNGNIIETLTGRRPKYYRSGTAYYDEIGVKIAEKLGYQVVGFSVLGDKGATYSKEEVKNALLNAFPGSIVICHMNHPEKETAAGVIEAIPELKRKGFVFVRLSDYSLK
ncbi:MAG: polysaccharide deacetylase family protein [Candidatus Omnitrophica bacterium]|nr:polysaccharide deacetylase family protein [Candidatus Omnitrophota bacterium]